MCEQMTREAAVALLVEFYTEVHAQEDPEWWEEMIQILLQQGTVAAARRWIE